MAYQKNTWASGDVVTSAKLNKMEQGIAGIVLDTDTLPSPEVGGEQFSVVQTNVGELEVYLCDFAELNGASIYYMVSQFGLDLATSIMEGEVEPVNPTTITEEQITMTETTPIIMFATVQSESLTLMPTDTVFVKGTQDPK